MKHNYISKQIFNTFGIGFLGLGMVLASTVAMPKNVYAQAFEDSLPPTEGGGEAAPAADPFSFEDEGLEFEQSTDELEDSFRREAFENALNVLMPLKPEEIRSLLERFDRTVESTELPVRPYPRPELVVQNISLDPGVLPLTIKLAFGYVTTLSMVDSSGQPWPIEDISWVGDFKIQESAVTDQTHMLRISPESKFAHGNLSMRLKGLKVPIIMTFETGQDVVHYRFDAVVPKKGPGGRASIIDPGVTLSAGDPNMSIALGGVIPEDAEILDVSGVDGRTSAFIYNSLTYLRTPLTLLSPAWDSSVTSADGTKVYALEETPVVLLSDKGRMVRAYLTEREELLDE